MLDRSEAFLRPPAPHPAKTRPGLLGMLLRVGRNPLDCWSSDFFHEPIAKFRLPWTDAFLVHHPPAIKHVLIDNSENYRKDPIQRRILSSGLADGLLSVEGLRWEIQRRTLAPLFSRRSVASFAGSTLTVAHHFADKWRRTAANSVIDVADEMTLITLNVLGLTIFSDGIGEDFDQFRLAMNAYFGAIGRIGVFDLFNVPRFVPRPGHRRLHRTMRYFEGVIDDLIDARRRRLASLPERSAPNDLLTLLLRSLDPSTGRHLSLAEMRSNILTFLSAGHETTANTLTWSMYLLSQSSEWRLRVQQEAERELNGPLDGLPDRLVATRAVIEETLRLYPPIAALSRAAEKDDVLEEFEVKPGSLVVIAPYVLHRHRRLWNQPDVFDPSRFMPDARPRIPRFAYLPFGIGPRTCIGASFALQEATIVLAVLIRDFDMRLRRGAEVSPLQRITLRPANGLPMHITPRNAAA